MSFQTPGLLLGLLALPLLGAWYARRMRERRLVAEAFAAPRLAASVLPNSPACAHGR